MVEGEIHATSVRLSTHIIGGGVEGGARSAVDPGGGGGGVGGRGGDDGGRDDDDADGPDGSGDDCKRCLTQLKTDHRT